MFVLGAWQAMQLLILCRPWSQNNNFWEIFYIVLTQYHVNPNAKWKPEPLESLGVPTIDLMFQSLSSQGTASDFVTLLLWTKQDGKEVSGMKDRKLETKALMCFPCTTTVWSWMLLTSGVDGNWTLPLIDWNTEMGAELERFDTDTDASMLAIINTGD